MSLFFRKGMFVLQEGEVLTVEKGRKKLTISIFCANFAPSFF